MIPRTREPSVLVVSRNVETVESLRQYLTGAGIETAGGDSMEALAKHKPRRGRTGLVLFPDDFPLDAVDREISAIDRRAPRSTVVLVTSTPKRFADRAGAKLVVLPRPAWAWAILDAINGRLDDTAGGADL